MIDINDIACAVSHAGGSFYFEGSSFIDSIACPITEVTWYGAVEYCNWVTKKEGLQKVYSISAGDVSADLSKNGYRLSTEAEWEYAARNGGRDDRKWSGTHTDSVLGKYAWYYSNSSNKAHPVGTKYPNDLELYNMSGNVWEWCGDWYGNYSSSPKINPTGFSTGSGRVARGGYWYAASTGCRTAYRTYSTPPNDPQHCRIPSRQECLIKNYH